MSYLKDLSIVTIGVLIALVISNFKENNQAKKYQIASIETVKHEVEKNHTELRKAVEQQIRALDTIYKYSDDHISLFDLLHKTGGLQFPTLSNTGLEFYTKNQISSIDSIDFKMISTLIQMNKLSDHIDTKLEKLMDFLSPNVYVDSKESKVMTINYLCNALDSEKLLMNSYENFIDEYIKTVHNK